MLGPDDIAHRRQPRLDPPAAKSCAVAAMALPKPGIRGESASRAARRAGLCRALARRGRESLRRVARAVPLVAAILFAYSHGACADEWDTRASVEERAPGAAPEGRVPTKSLWDMIVAGGPMMAPLAGCSIVLLIFVFERAFSLRRGRVVPRPFVKRFLHQLREGQLDREGALALCEENGSPVATVFSAALRKWGRPAVEVEQAILDCGERVVTGLRRYLRVLSGLHTVSPLLGLFGTVTGIITAFNAVSLSRSAGRAEMLASGISEALLATAAGLIVAIPALVAYLYFVGRVDQLTVDIDALGQELVGIISAEAMQESKSSRSPRKAA